MLVDISSATLRKMVKLSERKERLLSQIQELDRQMVELQQPAEGKKQAPFARAARVSRPANRRNRRAPRGALKAKIVGALRASGQRGLTIHELSEKLSVKPANLYVWFNDTGRKTRGIKKLGPAKYRFSR